MPRKRRGLHSRPHRPDRNHAEIHALLSGGDRRSIADSRRVRALVERTPSLVAVLAELAFDDDRLVALRAIDLLEKLAHDHLEWVEPHKRVFLGPMAESDMWEVRLQVVRALPLFHWTRRQLARVEAILTENLSHPQIFVRVWSLDSLAQVAEDRPSLWPLVHSALNDCERSRSKALRARARRIRERLGESQPSDGRQSVVAVRSWRGDQSVRNINREPGTT